MYVSYLATRDHAFHTQFCTDTELIWSQFSNISMTKSGGARLLILIIGQPSGLPQHPPGFPKVELPSTFIGSWLGEITPSALHI